MRQRNIANDAARLARAAQGDMAGLQRAMKAARDAAAGLQSAIKAPLIRATRHKIKSTTSNPLASLPQISLSFSSGTSGSGSGDGDGGGTDDNDYGNVTSSPSSIGYQSSSQAAGNFSLKVKLGQRNL